MTMTKTVPGPRRKRPAAFWLTPATSVALGIAMGAAAWTGGDRGLAVFAVVLMTALAVALVVAASYSETVGRLLDRRDERITGLDRDASLFAGMVLLVAVLGGFIGELATGGDGRPYSWMGAIAGVSYVAALIVLRLRR